MRRVFYIRLSTFVCVVLGLAGVAGDHRLSGQTTAPDASQFEIGAVRHETRAESQTSLELPSTNEFPSENETVSPPPPTRSSFMATWLGVTRAKGYLLDVSTSSSFDSFVDGYHDLDVGDVTGRVVTGLSRGTTYHYRVRAYDAAGAGNYSDVMTATTVPTVGLIIHPTFDSSITSNPNAAAIEAMITRGISFHESLFTDPITIQIRFRYSTTAPDGMPLSMGTLALTNILLYQIPWSSYISALRADATTSNDTQANASLPGTALSANIRPSSAAGRAVGLNTPPAMFANGSTGQGGPYDAIVTLNSAAPYQFNRPPGASNFDAQSAIEHEVDEAIGLGSRLGGNGNDLRPQDLFSWSSPGNRNISTSGTRYFSINGGATNIVNFNQNPDGDLGDWFSEQCPQTHPYVQNAFACAGQYSDISATSPEGISLDVIGYDLVDTPSSTPTPTPQPTSTPTGRPIVARAVVADFNGDASPDLVVQRTSPHQTAVLYLNNNVVIGAAVGPTLPPGWTLAAAADFNGDGHTDYALFNSATGRTAIVYLSGLTVIGAAAGPSLAPGWELVATADFNGDGHADYVLYKASTHETAIWHLNNNVFISAASGPTLPGGWNLAAVADFNGDGHPDYALFNSITGQTVIGYLSGGTVVGAAFGPTVPGGWPLVATADFSQDGHADYLLYNPMTRQTAIGYLNNNVLINAALGPTLPAGWSLVGQ
jgi:FG-GAP-like repeat